MNANFEFHNVGQGLFYTGQIETINFIFDCGYKEKYKNKSDKVVKTYLASLNDKQIDVFFISHLHYDHISGLDNFPKYINIKYIVLPYLTIEERLLLAYCTTNPPTWYISFLINPANYFIENFKNIEKIIFITERKQINSQNEVEINEAYYIKFQLENVEAIEEMNQHPEKVSFYNHKGSIGIFKGDDEVWNFKLYNYIPQDSKFNKFKKEIRRLLNNNDSIILDIKQRNNPDIKETYQILWKDLNITSLAILHKPNIDESIPFGCEMNFFDDKRNNICNEIENTNCCNPATILFGDIKLNYKNKKRIIDLFNHLTINQKESFYYIQLSHHGSITGWDKLLLFQQKCLYICSHGFNNTYNHPDKMVLKAIKTNKKTLFDVTEFQNFCYQYHCNII